MDMRLATQQSPLLPWAGFWQKLAVSDRFGILVDVQLEHGGYQNRVQLCDGWLTVPVAKSDRHNLIKDVRVGDNWAPSELLKTIRGRMPKKRFPFLDDRCDRIFSLLDSIKVSFVHDLNSLLLYATVEALGLKDVDIVEVPYSTYHGQTKTERFIEQVNRICMTPGTYLAGPGTVSFLEPDKLAGWSVDLQQKIGEVAHEERYQSVLYWMGKYENPMELMMGQFEFTPLYGGLHELRAGGAAPK